MTRFGPVLRSICSGALLAGLIGAGRAATATGNLSVTANIINACLFTAGNMAFGAYTGAQLDASGTVSVTCTNTSTFNIGINAGLHSAGNYDWEMLGPAGALLPYKVYVDGGRTVYWGGTPGYDTVNGTGTGAAQNFTMYGRIGAGQFKGPGAYADTVTFTLYF